MESDNRIDEVLLCTIMPIALCACVCCVSVAANDDFRISTPYAT